MAPSEDVIKLGCGCCVIFVLIIILTTIASCKAPTRDEQLVIHYLSGKEVVNGPATKVVNPFRSLERRRIVQISNLEYVRISDTLNGDVRVVEGPKRFFMTAYEESEAKTRKPVVRANQYVRMVDQLSGVERVITGPASVVPGPWEVMKDGVQQASFVNREAALVVLNRALGTTRLVTQTGAFIPQAYEDVIETNTRTQVQPHETMVVRNAFGRYRIQNGSGTGGTSTGSAFFLYPYEEIVTFMWSAFSQPPEGERQVIGKTQVQRIDMRVRKVFYQYEARTVDNVALLIEGSIFWRIVDVAKLLKMTGDPTGDVWYRARGAVVSAIGKVDFQTFMVTFNPLIKSAFLNQTGDDFWTERGVEVKSIEITKYEFVDPAVAETVQEIIEETTNRINQLQTQRSENEVESAGLFAEIALERERNTLIVSQAKNDILLAAREGEAYGVQLANSVTTFIDGLNTSLPDLDQRVKLYKLHQKLENRDIRTQHISGSDATIFVSPEDLGIELNAEDRFRHFEL